MPFVFVLLAIFVRVLPHVSALHGLPHLPNFTPVAAIAIFSGVYFKGKYAVLIPMAAMFLSDLFIGFYSPYVMAAVYGSFILAFCLGRFLKKYQTVGNLVVTALLSSMLFYLITNFAVWAFPGSFVMYPKTLQGLLDCFVMGLPFFRNTALGDLFYSGVLFGSYELVRYLATKDRAVKV